MPLRVRVRDALLKFGWGWLGWSSQGGCRAGSETDPDTGRLCGPWLQAQGVTLGRGTKRPLSIRAGHRAHLGQSQRQRRREVGLGVFEERRLEVHRPEVWVSAGADHFLRLITWKWNHNPSLPDPVHPGATSGPLG